MTTINKSSKAMNASLWAVQVLLAVMFLMSGFMKVSMPIDKLSAMLPWVTSVPAGLVIFIGMSELFGGLGLILPSLFRIKPTLTVWAGVGLAIIMLLAMPFHIFRGETPMIGMNAIFMLLAFFVSWGRWKKAPIKVK